MESAMTSTRRPKIYLVSSAGGHLAQLLALRAYWEGTERTWVTFDMPDARSQLAGERTIWAYHPTTRNLFNLARNFALAMRLLRRDRPEIVISDGAGVAVPFFVVAKLLGIRTVYIEVFDRIDSTTMTARLCRPFTEIFCVQWQAQLELYPDAHLIGPLL
jgi:UDP-N-acetylglucosamine:LPS N-acetylglucosamine transferase